MHIYIYYIILKNKKLEYTNDKSQGRANNQNKTEIKTGKNP